MKRSLILSSLLLSSLFGEEGTQENSKWQVAYLAKSGKIAQALESYMKGAVDVEVHDFEVLEQIAKIVLDEGARSNDPQKQLVSIYGARLAGIASPLDLLEEGVKSQNPETQLACIQSLASFQDDRCDDLLLRAMSSNFLPVRLEAGYYLSMRKHPAIAGQLEALLGRIPPFFRFIFPEFFALIGTKESMTVLRALMDDEEISCRTEAILSAARNGRDDLLATIRKRLSHQNHAIQEACATAVFFLQDTSAIARLKQLTKSSSNHVKIAAARALVQFGDEEAKEIITALVKEKDLFAIGIAGELEIALDELAKLTLSSDVQVRLNAAIALLNAHDLRAFPSLFEILLRDTRDLGIATISSPGRSLSAWKIIPSLTQRQEIEFSDLFAITIAVREHLLRECLELGEVPFLSVAKIIFDRRESSLAPLLCHLLENLRTPDAIALLRKKANAAGEPFIRTYAALTLFRLGLGNSYEESLKSWLTSHSNVDIIEFRPPLPFHRRPLSTPYELTPEETSRLLIEIYQAFADKHTKEGVDLLLKALQKDRSINRYALAGLLLRSLQ